jgi:hypothetical protein
MLTSVERESMDLSMYERLRVAVESLVGVGDIRDRLFGAFLTIGVFKVEELPDDIQNDYRQTMEDLSWLPAEGDEGKVRATLNEMSDDEATALAERIFRMFVRGAESRE